DFTLMNEAAQVLLEYSDFTSFSKTGTDVKTNICRLTQAHWDEVKPGQWRFTVTANRFLRNMVRAIVGTLVDVGRHRMSIEQMRHAIEARDRQRTGESVPGHALYLTRIEY
ncbi:MAG TPA: tRNA pseudouridine(38-40) synthase TruA, partial [Prevotellaceae bacterium]|nr:tRNA pseudouridine(38-40) synthase TruA [Prevotellaceae bacterium]